MRLSALCAVLCLLFGLHGAAAVAQPEVELDLQVLDDDVRYFVALGTQILELASNGACSGENVPFTCCTGEGTGTCGGVIEADRTLLEPNDSWRTLYELPADYEGPIADLAYGPDGRIYVSLPGAGDNVVLRFDFDTGTTEPLYCADSCEPTDLGFNYYGDLLAVDASTGGLLAWIEAVALCSYPEVGRSTLCYEPLDLSSECFWVPPDPPPYPCCTGQGSGCDFPAVVNDGELVPGSADLGSALIANQEWYTGQMAVIRDAVQGSKKPPKTDPQPAQLLKADNPEYLTSFAPVRAFDLEGSPTDLTVSQAQAFYTEGKKLWRLDLASGDSFECESFGNESVEFVTGDVGGVVYVGTANNQDYRVRKFVWDGEAGCNGTELELKRFNKNDWDRVPYGGVTTTYSTLLAEATPLGEATYLVRPDDMHNYRFTAICPEGITCPIEATPVPLLEALSAIESSKDTNVPFDAGCIGLGDPYPCCTDPGQGTCDEDEANDRLGLPFNLPGQSHPWKYEVNDFVGVSDPVLQESFEFHEFSTAVSGTNFRLACCTDACEPGVYCPECEWGALIYALPIASDIVPDPRGTRRGTGSACYESLTSTRNSNKPAEFCGWNSPLVPTPPDPFDFDAFFCGPGGVTSVSSGDTLPVKFNVGVPGGDCSSNEDLPYDLNILFSAGVAGSCVGDTFVPLDEVEAILGIEPNGEGEIDPRTGQVKFAKSGPKKQYQFNFDTGQVPLEAFEPPDPDPPVSVRTIVLINATFLEDSIEEGDQSIFLAVDP